LQLPAIKLIIIMCLYDLVGVSQISDSDLKTLQQAFLANCLLQCFFVTVLANIKNMHLQFWNSTLLAFHQVHVFMAKWLVREKLYLRV